MSKPTLDSLPVELRISILREIPDFTSLQALLLASREYYQAYNSDSTRSRILFELLCRQYNGQVDFVESLTTVRSKGLWAEDAKNTEQIIALLDFRRRASKEGSLPKYNSNSLTVKELVRLLKLHETANFLLEDYSESLEQPEWWQGDWKPIQFSPTERTRFFRAFYRFQTWCHIFGHMEYRHTRSKKRGKDQFINDWYGKTFSAADAWRLLWGTMPPWEVEEMACIWTYCDIKYSKIFVEVEEAFFAEFTPYDSDDEFLQIIGFNEPSRRDEIIAIGLCFFAKILRLNPKEREKKITNNLRPSFWTAPDRMLWSIGEIKNDERLPLLSPADRYEREDLVDVISSWPLLDQPNQAWTKYWCAGTPLHPDIWLIHPIEDGVPTAAMYTGEWEWGYVLWDTERILQWDPPVLKRDFDPWPTFTRGRGGALGS